MTAIKDILESKGSKVFTVERSRSVYYAIAQMAENGTGSLLVLDDGQPCGIVTERDYLKKVTLKGRSAKLCKVEDIMSHEVFWVDPDCSTEEAMAIMTEKRFRHLPIIHNGDVVGLISIGDLVRQVVESQKAEIRTLKDYIMGGYPR